MFSSFRQPRSSAEFKVFVSELEVIQGGSPELEVIVFGGIPSGRIVAFQYTAENGTCAYYVIPYPEKI
jgi:hypothetical protein